LNRLKRGDIYAPGKAQKAIENFFKESTLTALREMAFTRTAHELDLREKGMCPALDVADFEAQGVQSVPSTENETHDRILIYVSPDPTTAVLIRRGRRMADYLDADCFAVSVSRHHDLSSLSKGERS
jgi:two-component system, OmpR family, sensor histidine kinase KdpD